MYLATTGDLQQSKVSHRLSRFLPYCVMGGIAAVYLTVSAPALMIGLGFLGVAKLAIGYAGRSNPAIQRLAGWLGHRGYARMFAALLFGAALWGVVNGHAYAQFFGAAEEFFTTTFGDAAGETVPIVFGVLRALFLLYIAVSLIRVINAGRNDDDWQQLAKAPLIVVVAVVVADVLTGLVVGA